MPAQCRGEGSREALPSPWDMESINCTGSSMGLMLSLMVFF